MSQRNRIALATIAVAIAFASVATAQSPEANAEPLLRLPTDPRLWHNSPPLTLESLKGKGVVFYFFEEESPRLAANWPTLQGLSKQYEGKPLIFIAVSSGTDPRVLKRYLGQYRVGWPVIHDLDRSLEMAMGVPKLSPNVKEFAFRYVAGDGSRGQGQGADVAGTAESALKGAAWRVDPAAVPAKLLTAWRAVELGDFTAAARPLAQAVDAKDEQLKAGAEKLLAAVEEEVTSAATTAQEAINEGDEWTAYKRLESIPRQFHGYEFDLIERAESRAKELSKSDAVKDQIAAAKLLEKAMATASRGAGGVNRAKGLLNRLVEEHPETEAAAKAQEMLASIDR
jgi:thiol-disulfide isomerase/thioredoxin